MNESRSRTIRTFNPGTFQSDEEIIEQFVVRKRELGVVLDILHRNTNAFLCQPVLIVAPRGQGKTMLLARVAAALNTDTEFSRRLWPVRFMEESHEIFDLADFWLETLFYLARESAGHDPELAWELQEARADLVKRWSEEALVDHARATVLEAADRLDKKLVLMVENMQDLCENVDDDFGRQLRGALQSESQIMLLATATSHFEGLGDAEQPFFELFRTIDLEPLDTEECRSLWKVVSGDEVSGRAIRPLEILTGGSPRLVVIFSEFARHRSLSQLMEELVQLIDDHTEYFRGHLEALAKTERRVYLAAIDLWRPSSTGEIAARARMDVRIVSALLGRLVDRGMVRVDGSGKKRLYAAAERIYCLYYKLRRERDEAAVVSSLIHFMVAFYSEEEMAERVKKLIAEANRSPGIRKGIERAIAEAPYIGSFFPGIARPKMDRVFVLDTACGNERVERLLEEIAAMFQKAETHKEAGDFAAAIMVYHELIVRFGASEFPDLQVQIAWALSDKGDAQRELGDFAAAIATYEELIERFGASEAPECQFAVVLALSGKGDMQRELGDFAAAIATYENLIERSGASEAPECLYSVPWALLHKGDMHKDLGDFASAIVSYEALIEHFGASDEPESRFPLAWALCQRGDMQEQLGDLKAAIVTYDEVIARFSHSDAPELQVRVAWALSQKGDIHQELNDFDEALAVYDEVIERFGGSDAPELQVLVAGALSDKGYIFGHPFGDDALALAAYDELIMRFGDSDAPDVQEWIAWALYQKGIFQGQLGDFMSALVVYDEMIARFGDSESLDIQALVAWTLFEKGDTQRQLGDFRAAIAACDEIVMRFGASDAEELRIPVACALFDKGVRQIEMGHEEEALRTREEFARRSGSLTDFSKAGCALRAIWMRPGSLPIQGRPEIAADVFRFVYMLFVPGERTMMDMMQRIVLDLIVVGAPAHDLVEILSSDSMKASALTPLVIALLQYAGEAVRAPGEVLEVAADIRERIKERMAGGAGGDVPLFCGTGLIPGVDLSDSASPSDLMEEDRE